MQGDIVAIYNESGTKIGTYAYDAWGNVTTQRGTNTALDVYVLTKYNPFKCRGYYYDSDSGWYYLQSRYYSPGMGRFLNADGQTSGIGGEMLGNNLFAYAFNNPVNLSDMNGNWPEWLSGPLNVASGTLQMVAGAALGATVGWTGIGAVAAGVLIANGVATTTQGISQIVNDVAQKNVLREDNIIRTEVQNIGEAIGGDTGSTIAGGLYDGVVFAAGLYGGKVGLQQAGAIPVKVNINSLKPNPKNPMTDEGINYWTKTLAQNNFKGYNYLPNAYGDVEPICIQIGTNIITNGHHRVAVLAKYGIKTIKVFLVP